MKILIVDNEQRNLEATMEQFPDSDTIIYCTCCSAANKLMDEERYDFVVARYYWFFPETRIKRAYYSPVGLLIALDAYAHGIKSIILNNNFMCCEESDPLNIFSPGQWQKGNSFFEKAYIEGMILCAQQSDGYGDGNQVHWKNCIDYAINGWKNDIRLRETENDE